MKITKTIRIEQSMFDKATVKYKSKDLSNLSEYIRILIYNDLKNE